MMDLPGLHDMIGTEGAGITWLQMSFRGALIFLTGLLLVRLAGKRLFGKWGAVDTVVAVMIGSNLSRAMTGSAPFGPTLCATAILLLLHAFFIYASVFIPLLSPLVKGKAIPLVRDGVADRATMRRHGIGTGDLEEALRCHGIADLAEVGQACLERNGSISVIRCAA
jgi:uncharacterized membrane protein YcaP (DUF421 family)